MTTKRIEREHAETELERAALRWLNSEAKERDDGVEGVVSDLSQGGCASGMVGDLIYYRDTLPFYRRHREDIGRMLAESCADSGCSPWELLSGFDKEDPLALDTANQNLLAWFGFEEAVHRVCSRARIDC